MIKVQYYDFFFKNNTSKELIQIKSADANFICSGPEFLSMHSPPLCIVWEQERGAGQSLILNHAKKYQKYYVIKLLPCKVCIKLKWVEFEVKNLQITKA